MKHSLTIIDDFLADPAGLRAFALTHDFTQAPEYDGHKYEHFAPVKDARFSGWFEEQLAAVIGLPVAIKIATFTCLSEGQGTTQWIHSDNVCASHAAVIYLFDRPGYGTAFWRHNELCQDSLLPSDRDALNAKEFASKLQEDGKTTSAWTLTDKTESRYNRLIFYPSNRFHSRAVEHGFGDKPENARLTLAVFFDILPPL